MRANAKRQNCNHQFCKISCHPAHHHCSDITNRFERQSTNSRPHLDNCLFTSLLHPFFTYPRWHVSPVVFPDPCSFCQFGPAAPRPAQWPWDPVPMAPRAMAPPPLLPLRAPPPSSQNPSKRRPSSRARPKACFVVKESYYVTLYVQVYIYIYTYICVYIYIYVYFCVYDSYVTWICKYEPWINVYIYIIINIYIYCSWFKYVQM